MIKMLKIKDRSTLSKMFLYITDKYHNVSSSNNKSSK